MTIAKLTPAFAAFLLFATPYAVIAQ